MSKSGWITKPTENCEAITQEALFNWRMVINIIDSADTSLDKYAKLCRHYEIDVQWKDVFDYLGSINNIHFTDKLLLLNHNFKIKEIYCKCHGQHSLILYYDANGMCKKCGLRRKK